MLCYLILYTKIHDRGYYDIICSNIISLQNNLKISIHLLKCRHPESCEPASLQIWWIKRVPSRKVRTQLITSDWLPFGSHGRPLVRTISMATSLKKNTPPLLNLMDLNFGGSCSNHHQKSSSRLNQLLGNLHLKAQGKAEKDKACHGL